jgi:O-antigen ligase
MQRNQLSVLREKRMLISTSLLAGALFIGQAGLTVALVFWSVLVPFSRAATGKGDPKMRLLLALPICYGLVGAIISGLLIKEFGDLDALLKYVPFVLIPAGIWATRDIWAYNANFRLFSLVYIASAILTFLISFTYGLVGWIQHKNSIYLTYNHFAELFGVQPIYLSIFYLMAILLALDHYYKEKTSSKGFLAATGMLFLGIILLGSRSSLIIAGIVLLVRVYLATANRKRVLLRLGICVILGGVLVLSIPTLRNRFMRFDYNVASYSGISFRAKIWSNALIQAEASPVWGYGYTNSQEALQEQYIKTNFRRAQIANMNAHNQYIQTVLDSGVLGLLPLLLMLLIPIFRKQKSFTAMSFWIFMLVALVTESFFRRQFGVVFYTLFYSLFVIRSGVNHPD